MRWGIIGAIISIPIAVIGIYFAVKTYYNSDQINRLDSLVSDQKSQTDSLIAILRVLREQNGTTLSMYTELQTENQHLHNQENSLAEGITINNRHLALVNRHDSVIENVHLERLYLSNLDLFTAYQEFISYYKDWGAENRIEHLGEIKRILVSEKDNVYLHKSDTLYHMWMKSFRDLAFLESLAKNFDKQSYALISGQDSNSLSRKIVQGQEKQNLLDDEFEFFLQQINWLNIQVSFILKKSPVLQQRSKIKYSKELLQWYINTTGKVFDN